MDAVSTPRALLLGCAGTALSDAERDFYREANPLGFILFARNCESGEQVRALIAGLRAAVGRPDAPVLMDQEGGRVVRLPAPEWRRPPAPGVIGALADSAGADIAARAAWLHGALIGHDLAALGITVNCAPVLDLQFPGQSSVVGDRSFGADPALVTDLGRALMEGLIAAGVMPAIKHLPGHGRARADSHVSLPVVDAALEELRDTDFVPFRALADTSLGLTAHVLYTAIDEEAPATQSSRVIAEIIRGEIGFQGLLFTDDLSMGALAGDVGERASRALEAGCDIALHCNGEEAEMRSVVNATPRLSEATLRRWPDGLRENVKNLDNINELSDEFDNLIEKSGRP